MSPEAMGASKDCRIKPSGLASGVASASVVLRKVRSWIVALANQTARSTAPSTEATTAPLASSKLMETVL